MKHAYLILAHNEFEILNQLIHSIDDERNDIYIHFDKKTENIPHLNVNKSQLFIIENRIDVRWGDVSVAEAELMLFECASKQSNYSYYHLLSGVDMPLKSQNDIHDFFEQHIGKEFIGYSTYDYSLEVERKVRRIHLYPHHFRYNVTFKGFLMKLIRYLYLQFQFFFNKKRYANIDFKKGTQWVSITDNFVKFLISNKDDILSMYQNTFCCDEIYKHTLCWNSRFKNNIYNYNDESVGCMRMIGWKNGALEDWSIKDYVKLMSSNKMFARKFNSQNIDVVLKIKDTIKND